MGKTVVRKPGEGTAFWMLGGLYELKASSDETIEGGPGTFFYIAEGTWENFEPTSEIHILVIYTPGGMEKFFAEAGEPAQRREIPPPLTEPPDIERIMAIAEKYGLKMKAPQEA